VDFWGFVRWKQILCFQHDNQSYFLLIFAGWIVLYFAIHHCLLWVQKIRNDIFSYFEKAKGEFLARSHAKSSKKRLWTHLVIFINANVFTLGLESCLCALCVVYLDRAVSWHSQDANRQSMQRVQNTWSIGTMVARWPVFHRSGRYFVANLAEAGERPVFWK